MLLGLLRHFQYLELDASMPTGDAFGHLWRTLEPYHALVHGHTAGFLGFLYDQGSSFYPPVPYLVAALSYLGAGCSMATAKGSLALFLVALGAGAHLIGRRLWGPAGGALACWVALTSPGVVNNAPLYFLDVPLAGMVALNLACLVRVDGFRSRGWSLAAGLTMGLGVLTKQSFPVYVLPAWLVLAASGPLRPSRTGAVLWAAVLIQGAISLHWLAQGFTAAGLAGWVAVWAGWFLLDRGERRSRGNLLAAVALASLMAIPWLAHNLPVYASLTRETIVPEMRQLWSGQPGHFSLGGILWHGPAYALHLAHTLLPLPGALAALAVALGMLRRRTANAESWALVAAAFGGAAMISVAPVYTWRYALPLVPALSALAGGVVRWRLPLAGAVVLVLLPWGVVQSWLFHPAVHTPLFGIRGVSLFLDPQQGDWVALRGVAFPALVPTRGRSDLDELVGRLEKEPGSFPLLAVVPYGVYGALGYHARRLGVADRVLLDSPSTGHGVHPCGGARDLEVLRQVRTLLIAADYQERFEETSRERLGLDVSWAEASIEGVFEIPHQEPLGRRFYLLRLPPEVRWSEPGPSHCRDCLGRPMPWPERPPPSYSPFGGPAGKKSLRSAT